MVRPQKGDRVLWQDEAVLVAEIDHFLDPAQEPICLIITATILTQNYDALLRTLDWFKANYEVVDVNADSTPELYYSFYRSVVHVLGQTALSRPLIAYDPLAIKIVAESCRAVILAEVAPMAEAFPAVNLSLAADYNKPIQHLHELILAQRPLAPAGADLFEVLKIWEAQINPQKELRWIASVDQCVMYAKLVFARLKSVPVSALPLTLRESS